MFQLVRWTELKRFQQNSLSLQRIKQGREKTQRFFSNLKEFTIKTEVVKWISVHLIWDGHHDWKCLISTSSSSSNAILMNLVPRDMDGVSDNIKRTQLVIRDSGVRATNWINQQINAASKHCIKLSWFSNSLIFFLVGSGFSLLLSLF